MREVKDVFAEICAIAEHEPDDVMFALAELVKERKREQAQLWNEDHLPSFGRVLAKVSCELGVSISEVEYRLFVLLVELLSPDHALGRMVQHERIRGIAERAYYERKRMVEAGELPPDTPLDC